MHVKRFSMQVLSWSKGKSSPSTAWERLCLQLLWRWRSVCRGMAAVGACEAAAHEYFHPFMDCCSMWWGKWIAGLTSDSCDMEMCLTRCDMRDRNRSPYRQSRQRLLLLLQKQEGCLGVFLLFICLFVLTIQNNFQIISENLGETLWASTNSVMGWDSLVCSNCSGDGVCNHYYKRILVKLKIGVIGPSSDVKKLFAEGQRKQL